MKVATGREIAINGRRYHQGSELPTMPNGVAEKLIARGDIEADQKPRVRHDQDRQQADK